LNLLIQILRNNRSLKHILPTSGNLLVIKALGPSYNVYLVSYFSRVTTKDSCHMYPET
jgi:hypothetical protein